MCIFKKRKPTSKEGSAGDIFSREETETNRGSGFRPPGELHEGFDLLIPASTRDSVTVSEPSPGSFPRFLVSLIHCARLSRVRNVNIYSPAGGKGFRP